MTKKHFIALADAIKEHQKRGHINSTSFMSSQLETLAEFCKSQNPAFKKERWLDYIAGKCGSKGGKK